MGSIYHSQVVSSEDYNTWKPPWWCWSLLILAPHPKSHLISKVSQRNSMVWCLFFGRRSGPNIRTTKSRMDHKTTFTYPQDSNRANSASWNRNGPASREKSSKESSWGHNVRFGTNSRPETYLTTSRWIQCQISSMIEYISLFLCLSVSKRPTGTTGRPV